ncbi:MAG TPA: hypothetical protein VGR54_01870 [Nitrosopumilaceae archaeon]|nr:hypothetical protein [Nitrosopumilaceae archaeon]
MNKKIMRGAVAGGTAAVIIAIALLWIVPQSQPLITLPPIQPAISHNIKLGLAIMPPTQTPTLAEIKNAYQQATSTGIGRSNVYLTWPNIEPKEGQYNWKSSDILMGLNREQNLNVTLYFSVINDRILGPFPDWMGKPQFDQKLQGETVKTIDAVISRYYIVDHVIIGGDIDGYFRDHPNDIPNYVNFFDGVYSKLKAKHPDVKFGNWFSLNSILNQYQTDLVGKLNQGDFVAYSYYPIDSTGYESQSPEEKGKNLQKMLDLADGKKIALVEVGWSTAKSINGTKDDQVKFMKIVYDFYRKNNSQFEFLTWYRQYDRPVETCYNSLNKSPVGFGNDIVLNNTAALLCNMGLIDVDKNLKPAWTELKDQIQLSPNS